MVAGAAVRYGWVVVFAWVVLPAAVVLRGGMGMTMKLDRAFPTSHGVPISQLRERDRLRHGRFLQQQSSLNGVADFPVEGTFDPFTVGLYYTKVQLGSPPKEFYVQIDTGSDVLWVGCKSCSGCPTSSGLQHIQLEYFDPSASQTVKQISCSDRSCVVGMQSSDALCSNDNQCIYTFQYGDGSGASGFYVSDLMHFDSIVGNSMTSNSSAAVVFGCSTSQTGDLTKSDRAVDGIFGFGQQSLSVISQLASQGVTPNAFSHCLSGSSNGGGVLVLGQAVEPNIVYTPLVPSQPHYNLNLESIAVNGQSLPIASSVFATSENQGTIVDSGTTLAYLAEEAYDPFVNAINQVVLQSVQSFVSRGNQCYLVTSSLSEVFPQVSLNFAGGVSMILNPQDYLLQQNPNNGEAVWCIGFQKIQGQGLTILGDLVLKDKIVVYDLAGQRIGWASYDCSSPINVSATTSNGKSEFVNAGQIDNNGASSINHHKLIPITSLVSFLCIFIFGEILYL